MATGVAAAVWEIASGLVEGTGLELVDVEYVKERDWYLRVFIDKPGGIGIEDCQSLSERLEAELDRDDVIKESYVLEVSSPGLDRVLKKERDFIREMGKAVDVSLYEPMDGEKLVTGKLSSYGGEGVGLEGRTPIPHEKISQVRLHIDI